MAPNLKAMKYVPGAYAKKGASAAQIAERYVREWNDARLKASEKIPKEMAPTICFSRKIGVGALEIADVLAERIGYRVVDREILEHIADRAFLSEKTVALFDERYPGSISEFVTMAIGEKAFIKSDYVRRLFSVVYSIARMQPTIFVGRGAHLFLPRDKILAVRFISSRESRIKRVAQITGAKPEEVEKELDKIDREQRDFFKKVYGKKGASPYEFDMVINCDHIKEPDGAAEIVREAFEQKFGKPEAASWADSADP